MPAALEPARTEHRPAAPKIRRASPAMSAGDAFDLLPNAMMVCDERGRVVAANARLRADLGRAAGDDATCCSLLGCGRPGTDLEGDCITARAVEEGEALPQVWVDSASGRMRVTAAPLYDDPSHVVIELRRERRFSQAQPQLRVFTFGGLRVQSPDGELAGPWLDQRAGQLLRYLACERRRVAPADAIAEAIWPQAGAAAGNSVRHFVHVLREHLEPNRTRREESSYIVC